MDVNSGHCMQGFLTIRPYLHSSTVRSLLVTTVNTFRFCRYFRNIKTMSIGLQLVLSSALAVPGESSLTALALYKQCHSIMLSN